MGAAGTGHGDRHRSRLCHQRGAAAQRRMQWGQRGAGRGQGLNPTTSPCMRVTQQVASRLPASRAWRRNTVRGRKAMLMRVGLFAELLCLPQDRAVVLICF